MKAIKPAIASVLLALAALSPVLAQDGEGSVFAPYPSRIRIGVRGREIVLSWEDSSDIVSGYAVYRHDEFPDALNFERALLLGYSDSGSKGFAYAPVDDRPYYYFVLGRVPEPVPEGSPAEYRIFIPLRNVPIEPVALAAQAVPAAAPTVAASSERPRPRSLASPASWPGPMATPSSYP
ncbi:MAG TPA: hypothetical protein PLW80_07220 [Spirochaetales bacterium]|nr:hypothetical protein [Spirochaetales bacterium]